MYLPIILGTPRKGRESAKVAEFIENKLKEFQDIETEIIDVDSFDLSHDEDGGLSDRNPGYSEKMDRADGIIIVTPEYNHSFPGHLKSLLDMAYAEYDKKPVGLVSVSSGGFGGVRAIESLLSVLKALGLVTLKKDLNISKVEEFDPEDPKINEKATSLLEEVVSMAKALKDL